MASSTFTRYQCDWCRAEVEIHHTGPTVTVPERPAEWGRAQLEDEPYDLCAYCAEALRSLAASRGASLPTHALNGEFVAS